MPFPKHVKDQAKAAMQAPSRDKLIEKMVEDDVRGPEEFKITESMDPEKKKALEGLASEIDRKYDIGHPKDPKKVTEVAKDISHRLEYLTLEKHIKEGVSGAYEQRELYVTEEAKKRDVSKEDVLFVSRALNASSPETQAFLNSHFQAPGKQKSGNARS